MQANRSMRAQKLQAASCLVLMSSGGETGSVDTCPNFRFEKNYFVPFSCAARWTPLEPSFQGAHSLTSGSFTSFFTVTIMLLHFSYGAGNNSSTSRSNSGL